MRVEALFVRYVPVYARGLCDVDVRDPQADKRRCVRATANPPCRCDPYRDDRPCPNPNIYVPLVAILFQPRRFLVVFDAGILQRASAPINGDLTFVRTFARPLVLYADGSGRSTARWEPACCNLSRS